MVKCWDSVQEALGVHFNTCSLGGTVSGSLALGLLKVHHWGVSFEST